MNEEPETDDPGSERHAWETEFEALLPDLEDDPEGALPQLADLVERMLAGSGLAGATGGTAGESEHVLAFAAAAELAERARDGEDLPPGDVAFAVGQLRAIYESLLADPAAG